MGQRLNIFLNRVQDRAGRQSERLGAQTWGLMVRTWAPRTWPVLPVAALLLLTGLFLPGLRWPAVTGAVAVLMLGALPWLAAGIPLLVLAALNWRIRRLHRKAHKPPRKADGSVDWSAIDDYVLLSEAAWYGMPKTLESMMAGPMERFIQLCEDRSVPIRARARMMEFARGTPANFKRRRARRPDAARRVDETVMAELESRLGPMGSDGRYLIDVYLGKRTHNG